MCACVFGEVGGREKVVRAPKSEEVEKRRREKGGNGDRERGMEVVGIKSNKRRGTRRKGKLKDKE